MRWVLEAGPASPNYASREVTASPSPPRRPVVEGVPPVLPEPAPVERMDEPRQAAQRHPSGERFARNRSVDAASGHPSCALFAAETRSRLRMRSIGRTVLPRASVGSGEGAPSSRLDRPRSASPAPLSSRATTDAQPWSRRKLRAHEPARTPTRRRAMLRRPRLHGKAACRPFRRSPSRDRLERRGGMSPRDERPRSAYADAAAPATAAGGVKAVGSESAHSRFHSRKPPSKALALSPSTQPSGSALSSRELPPPRTM